MPETVLSEALTAEKGKMRLLTSVLQREEADVGRMEEPYQNQKEKLPRNFKMITCDVIMFMHLCKSRVCIYQ